MRQSIDDMSENERKFLLALIEDGSRTDTEIAEETDMSKATANRIRNKFEDNGTIHEYLPIVDLEAAAVHIYSMMIVEMEEEIDTDELADNPNVIFLGETDDFQQTMILFTGFKGFDGYHEFIRKFKDQYSDKVKSFDKKLISPDKIFKEDFTHLIKHNLKEGLEK
jgi:DNA-binding Lrp family transcriptional regulator